MKKCKIKQKILTGLFIILFLSNIVCIKPNYAITPNEIGDISGRWFYIKNAYTGKYLDVVNGTAQAGNYVQQYEFNGSNAQKWYFYYEGNGLYTIASKVGTTIEGNTEFLNFALDVDNGINEDGTKVHLWDLVSGDTQLFTVTKTSMGTYVLRTKCSNWNRCVTINTDGCSNGIRTCQRWYNNDADQEWILEPVTKYNALGITYAEANWNNRVLCYPDCSKIGGDCANFVSQCLLAAGVHRNSNWYMDKLNHVYQTPAKDTTQLDASWSYSSSWINANSFKKYWKDNAKRTYACTGKYAKENMFDVYHEDYVAGDVIQYIEKFATFELDAKHTMYITDYKTQTVNGTLYPSYIVTYHSTDTPARPLTELYNMFPDYNFRMYEM